MLRVVWTICFTDCHLVFKFKELYYPVWVWVLLLAFILQEVAITVKTVFRINFCPWSRKHYFWKESNNKTDEVTWNQWMRGKPGGVLGLTFAGYVPLASQSPYPIIVYSVANYYRPHLSHSNMWFSLSQLSHFLFKYLPYDEWRTLYFSPTVQKLENVHPHSSNCIENVTLL